MSTKLKYATPKNLAIARINSVDFSIGTRENEDLAEPERVPRERGGRRGGKRDGVGAGGKAFEEGE
jgi:hypothetical protein